MEKEEFLRCKNEIKALFDKYGVKWNEFAKICSYALTDIVSENGYVATIAFYPYMREMVSPQSRTSVRIQIADEQKDAIDQSQGFLSCLKRLVQEELQDEARATPDL